MPNSVVDVKGAYQASLTGRHRSAAIARLLNRSDAFEPITARDKVE